MKIRKYACCKHCGIGEPSDALYMECPEKETGHTVKCPKGCKPEPWRRL